MVTLIEYEIDEFSFTSLRVRVVFPVPDGAVTMMMELCVGVISLPAPQ